MGGKSILILERDPLKRKRRSFEIGYWRFSEYFVSERLLKEGWQVTSLDDESMPHLWLLLKWMFRREWIAEYYLSLFQTAMLAFSRKSHPIACAWQGPGFVFAAIRKLLARSSETKLIVVMYYSYTHNTLRHAIIRRVLGWVLRDSTTIVCITSTQRKEFEKSFRLKPGQVRYLRRGVDTVFFSPLAEDRETGINDYVFCTGEYDRDDRLLLSACMDLGLKLIRVTKEPEYALEILRIAKNIGVREIEVLMKVDAETLRRLYRNSLFVVVPVKNDTHPAGLTSLLESMACGKATIVSEGLTTEDYARDMVDAVYFNRGDLKSLKDRMALLRDDAHLRAVIGGNARKAVEDNHRIEDDVDGLMRVVGGLMA
ncbi:MAG: glycosyltransferase family 4 protein [Candidatus Altiarchaeota archaeon]